LYFGVGNIVVYNISVSEVIRISDTVSGSTTQIVFSQLYWGIFLGLFLAIIIQGFVVRWLYDVWINKIKVRRKYLITFILIIFLILVFLVLWDLTYQQVTIEF